ncbi:Growth-regulating factor 8 [Raphanus sativus]|nr:Growth-regulating factor 8 [Raphanus sativus]
MPMDNIRITPEATYEAVIADSKLFMGSLERLHSQVGEMGRSMSEKEGVAFSKTQWQELERQRNIYKYMMASLPVPSELLTPFSKNPSHTNHQHGKNLLTFLLLSLLIMFDN